MDLRQRTKRFGWCMILCACVLRLSFAGITGGLWRQLSDLKTAFPIYSETGRNVRFLSSSGEPYLHVRESPQPWIPEPEKVRFSAEDMQLLEMDYDCGHRPDLEGLLRQPLNWDLRQREPAVLILHTHTTESYTKKQEKYEETSQYRTLDESYNMLSVGDEVAHFLEQAGIAVIHDRQIHDYPSYNGSYVHARSALEELLDKHPSVQLVLDLHRDALEKDGRQVRTVAGGGEVPVAQLMFVVGTDATRKNHKNWEENLSLALKLQILLEKATPGIMRPVNLREQRFNQDLHRHALLVEVGTAGNSHTEALAAARKLAEAIAALAPGAEGEAPKDMKLFFKTG